jgi:hypothetical protein
MAHNANKREQLAAVLATPVSHYRSWVLTVSCPKCRDKKELRIEPWIGDGKGGQPVSAFLARLVCAVCRSSPSFVRLQSRSEVAPKGSAPIREIILVGAGAY